MSLRLVETNLFSSNLNTLKYLHLQSTIHKDKMVEFIKKHDDTEINTFVDTWNDNRFLIEIIKDDTNSSIYYLTLETADSSHIRLSQKIIK